jgi:uncharacterized Zn finger protein (UPF0148 family)
MLLSEVQRTESGVINVGRALAIKKGQTREKALGFQEMGTLRCDICGEEFFIVHDPAFADKKLAEKKVKWLEKVLAEEHERDKKHLDRIELPTLAFRPLLGCKIPAVPGKPAEEDHHGSRQLGDHPARV